MFIKRNRKSGYFKESKETCEEIEQFVANKNPLVFKPNHALPEFEFGQNLAIY
jgi:hypothetical protein